MRTRLLPFIPYFFLAVFLASCATFKDPEYRSIENLRVSKLGFSQSTLSFDIHYFNPNHSRLKLKKAKGDVWIENKYLGKFSMDTLILIPANGEFRMPVKLEVDMRKIMENSIVAFLSREVTVKVEGKAKVGKSFIYISYPLRYEGKHKLGELMK
ncbi:MAG TPA: LEA type 2 family protein [Chitinophagaceae bacterium]|jgi:LEA14-like dessication related protein|nr:LEA type 2 family protein [Chitinophagaceae bacterium]